MFDAERLKEIISELGQQLQPLAQDKRLQNIDHTITLVDGSLIAALPHNDNAGLNEVISDEIVEFKGTGDRKLDHTVRVICVRMNPHTTRGKSIGGSSRVDSDGILRIATNLLDVPADVIALMFAYRWAIEIFFRFFKQMLGCKHLLSHKQNGIEIQTYCAIIACMLIALWTGRKPTKRTYEMICFYFCGLASEAELMAHIEKLKKKKQ